MALVAVTRDPLDLPGADGRDCETRRHRRRRSRLPSQGWCGTTTRDARCAFSNTRRTSRWRVRALDLIVAEARETWPDARLAMHHRIGRIEIGEASIIIVAASAHRAHAFAACRYAIERVKQIVPDLEARTLRGRRSLAGRRDRGPGRREGEAGGVPDRMRVTVRLFARLRDLAGAGELVREVPAPATVQTVWKSLTAEMPALVAVRTHDVGGGQRGIREDGGGRPRRR